MKFLQPIFVAVALASPLTAGAETLLELDFQNLQGTESKARHQTSGASDIGELIGEAQIDPGPTGIEKGIEQIRKGALIVEKQMPGACFTMKNIATGGASNNACFSDYSRTNGFGTGTMIMVFKPNFLTAGGRGNTIFCTNAVSTQPGFFAIRTQGKKLGLYIGAKDDLTTTLLELPDWEAGQWYFLAFSWQENSPPTVYARLLGSDSGFFTAGTKPVMAAKDVRHAIRIGNGHNIKDSAPDSMMDGRMAYFLWTDAFTDSQAAFDTLYEGIAAGK